MYVDHLFSQGSEEVLRMLGYTVSTPDGFVFPHNYQPNLERIAQVAADLKIVHEEMLQYSIQSHPNAALFEKEIPQQWQ